MDLNQAKIFYQVATLKSFSAVSEMVGCSKSTISKTIRKLENELGGVLLIRNSKKIEMTFEGRKLYALLEEILGQIENFTRKVKIDQTLKILIVGNYATWAQDVALKCFKEKFWNIIFLYETDTERAINRVKSGEVHGIVTGKKEYVESDLERKKMTTINFGYITSFNFNKNKEYDVYVPEIAELTRGLVDEMLKSEGLSPKRVDVLRYDYFDVLEMIGKTNDIALVLIEAIDEAINKGIIKIQKKIIPYDVYFLYSKNQDFRILSEIDNYYNQKNEQYKVSFKE